MSKSITQVFQRHALDDVQALPLLLCSLIGAAVISSYALSFAGMLKQWAFGGISLNKFGAKKGSWAIVTGATQGIGAEFASQLAKAGFNILLISRSESKLNETATTIKGKYSKIETKVHSFDFVAAQQQDWDSLKKVVDGLEVGVLVNNVGKSHDYPEYFAETPAAECDDIIKVNVDSLVKMTRLVVPGMVHRKRGLILNMGSFSAWMPSPLLATYSASKSFVNTFSQALGSELKDKGIVVSHINTYFVVSNMSKIRRATPLIPMPKTYVASVLSHIGQPVGAIGSQPYTSTPYLAHALIQYLGDRIGTWPLWFWYNKNLHVDIRRRALRKKERLAKGQ